MNDEVFQAVEGEVENEPPTPTEMLRERLDTLRQEAVKADFEKQLVDESIKDLEKLVAEIEKSKQALRESYQELLNEDTRLFHLYDNTKSDIENILREEGLQAVKDVIDQEIEKIDNAEDVFEALQGRVPDASDSSAELWERGAVGDARAAVANADAEFAAAVKKLTGLRTMAAAVADRQKKKAVAIDEVLKQGRSGQPALAYWLLTETGQRDKRHHVILDGTEFCSGMTEPKLIEPDELEKALSDAWLELEQAGAKRITHHATLKALEEELKVAGKNLSDLKKDFSNNVKDALVAWQANRLDPLS